MRDGAGHSPRTSSRPIQVPADLGPSECIHRTRFFVVCQSLRSSNRVVHASFLVATAGHVGMVDRVSVVDGLRVYASEDGALRCMARKDEDGFGGASEAR